MNDYKSAFNAAAADLGAIIALLGFTKYPGVDPVLRAITDLMLEKAENQVLREERDAALARAAELEGKLAEMEKPVPTHGEHSELRRIAVALKNPLLSGEEASDLMVRYEALTMPDHIIALIDRQAQHSVPIAPELKRALGLVVAALEADGDRPTSKYALSELKKVLAGAPGKEGV